MSYPHVVVTLDGEPKKPRCVLKDLSESDLRTRFVKPYRKGEDILCGQEVIRVVKINLLQLIRTERPSQVELDELQDRNYQQVQEFNRTSSAIGFFGMYGHHDEHIVSAGDDVTSKFISGPPGQSLSRRLFNNDWAINIIGGLAVAAVIAVIGLFWN